MVWQSCGDIPDNEDVGIHAIWYSLEQKSTTKACKEISAGLYSYVLEEFGKLILVKESKSKNNQYEINCSWFKTPKAPKYKFPKAFVIWKKIIMKNAMF